MKKPPPPNRLPAADDGHDLLVKLTETVAELSRQVHELRGTLTQDTLALRSRLHVVAQRLEVLERRAVASQDARPARTADEKRDRANAKAAQARAQLARDLKAKNDAGT